MKAVSFLWEASPPSKPRTNILSCSVIIESTTSAILTTHYSIKEPIKARNYTLGKTKSPFSGGVWYCTHNGLLQLHLVIYDIWTSPNQSVSPRWDITPSALSLLDSQLRKISFSSPEISTCLSTDSNTSLFSNIALRFSSQFSHQWALAWTLHSSYLSHLNLKPISDNPHIFSISLEHFETQLQHSIRSKAVYQLVVIKVQLPQNLGIHQFRLFEESSALNHASFS